MATSYETFNAPDDMPCMEYLSAPDEPIETCGSCGAKVLESDSRYMANGWNFLACPSCVEDCKQAEALEILQGAECVKCGSTKGTVLSDRTFKADAVCCSEPARKPVAPALLSADHIMQLFGLGVR